MFWLTSRVSMIDFAAFRSSCVMVVVVVRGAEGYVYAAADINTPSDIVDASDDRGFVISVAGAYAQRGEKCKRDDQYGNNEENGFSYSFLQM